MLAFNLTSKGLTREQDSWLKDWAYDLAETTPLVVQQYTTAEGAKAYVKVIMENLWLGTDDEPLAFIVEDNPIFLLCLAKQIQQAISFVSGKEFAGMDTWTDKRHIGVAPRYLYWLKDHYEVVF